MQEIRMLNPLKLRNPLPDGEILRTLEARAIWEAPEPGELFLSAFQVPAGYSPGTLALDLSHLAEPGQTLFLLDLENNTLSAYRILGPEEVRPLEAGARDEETGEFFPLG